MSLANSLRLSGRDIEARISYPPYKKKEPPLPPVRSGDSRRLLDQYQETVREKRRQEARDAPALNFTLQASAASAKESRTTQRLVEDGKALYDKACSALDGGTDKAATAEGYRLLEDAAAVLKEAGRLGVDTPELHALLGDVCRRRELYQEAVDYYSRSLTLVGQNFLSGDWAGVRLFRDRAECYTEMGLEAAPKAAQEYDNYMQMTEPTFDVLLSAGKAHLDSGHLRRSGELFDMALQEREASPLLHFYLGELREREHDSARAKQHFARAAEVDPDFSKPYREEAERLIAQGSIASLSGALSLYQSVLKLHPEEGELYIRLADVYDLLGSDYMMRSMAMLDAALALPLPREVHESALVRRGVMYIDNLGEVDSAVADFTQGLLLNPQHPLGLERRAAALRQRANPGDLHQAALDYEVLTALDTVSDDIKAGAFFFLAEWYFDLRLEGPDPYEDPAGATQHYQDLLGKAAAAFSACSIRGGGGADFSRATPEGRLRLEKVMLSVACTHGYLLRAQPPPAQTEARPPSKGDKGGVPPPSDADAEDATKCEPLTLRFLAEHYQWHRSMEPTVHTELFLELLDGPHGLQFLGFKAYLDDWERRKAAAEALRGGKKGKKK